MEGGQPVADPKAEGTRVSAKPGLASQVWARARKYAGRGLIVLGGVIVVNAGAAAWEAQQRAKLEKTVSKPFILELDLETCSVVEKAYPSPLELLIGGDRQLGLSQLLHALREAGRDTNCQGLVAYVGPREGFRGGLAQVQEVRNAVFAFKAAASQRLNSFSVPHPLTAAFSSSLGEAGTQGTIPYYFATAFDKIYVQPTGMVSTTGFESTMFFIRGLLDKLKIKPQFLAREEYKNAANMFTESSMNAPQRESMESILQDYANQVKEGIAAARKLDNDAVTTCIERAPHLASDATARGLIDGTKYKDEVLDLMCKSSAVNISGTEDCSSTQKSSSRNSNVREISGTESSSGSNGNGSGSAKESSDSSSDKRSSGSSSGGGSSDSSSGGGSSDGSSGGGSSDGSSGGGSGSCSVKDNNRIGRCSSAEDALPRVTIQKYLDILAVRQHVADRDQEKEQMQRAYWKKAQEDARRWLGLSGEESTEGGQKPREKVTLSKLKERERRPHIALVMLSGPIMQGGPSTPPPTPDPSGKATQRIESRKLAKQFQDLAKLDSVKAVVIRVNSPGGSAVASDMLHREILKLKEAGKKVVVSMGDVAASGGYFISAPADKIVAMPGTLTGSIGVVMGKFNVSGFLSVLGVHTESLQIGQNASSMSAFADWTPEQLDQADKMIEGIYMDFLSKVASGRGLTMEQARRVAKGRVWTGNQAKQLGLVDELGGLVTALELARDMVGLPTDEDVSKQVVEYPPPWIPPWLLLFKNTGANKPAQAALLMHTLMAPMLTLLGPSGQQDWMHNASAPRTGSFASSMMASSQLTSSQMASPLSTPASSSHLEIASASPAVASGLGGAFASPLLWQLPILQQQSLMALLSYLPHTHGLHMLSWEAEAFTHVA